MLEISNFNDKSIKQILTTLESKQEVNASLPGGGFLHIEKEIPYLIIYRKKENDKGIRRIVVSEASYLVVGDTNFEDYKELISSITNKLSGGFKTYMLFEIYSGEEDSNTFLIKGPKEKLSTSLNVLKEELEKINNAYSGLYLQAKIKDTPIRQPDGEEALMDIEKAKLSGGVVVSLGVPPVFRTE